MPDGGTSGHPSFGGSARNGGVCGPIRPAADFGTGKARLQRERELLVEPLSASAEIGLRGGHERGFDPGLVLIHRRMKVAMARSSRARLEALS